MNASVMSVSATLWIVAHQAPLSRGSSRQEYWSGLPFPSPGDLPDPGIELKSPGLAGGFFTTSTTGKHLNTRKYIRQKSKCILNDCRRLIKHVRMVPHRLFYSYFFKECGQTGLVLQISLTLFMRL